MQKKYLNSITIHVFKKCQQTRNRREFLHLEKTTKTTAIVIHNDKIMHSFSIPTKKMPLSPLLLNTVLVIMTSLIMQEKKKMRKEGGKKLTLLTGDITGHTENPKNLLTTSTSA